MAGKVGATENRGLVSNPPRLSLSGGIVPNGEAKESSVRTISAVDLPALPSPGDILVYLSSSVSQWNKSNE